MEVTALCAAIVCLRLFPSRSQFFQFESVSLSCEGNSSEFRVRRNTSKQINELCVRYTECISSELYESDSGVYWCESAAGERSDAVNISVTDAPLILERPERPVGEGESLTLHCRVNPRSFSSLTRFYRNGVLVGSSSTGRLTIRSVSKSDEGFYKCNASGVGESAETWLAVRGPRLQTPPAALAHILLPVVTGFFLLVMTMLLCVWRNHIGSVDSVVSYTVIVTQEGKTHQLTEPQDGPVLGRVRYVRDSLAEGRLSCHQSRLWTEDSRGSL
ncbi:high affinity immunoglobulin gamma Fc receptor I-like [Poecilia formosa]|uniref:high affinity immunoglobulin gamma Fc receptor I-like n=1 Tax=Poecilia formosa TaxID=48698 RepID=UPI000443FFE9|nr:PREDICTED: high affinity immunoglobulin gamma Fc receptor I-like [Poecilia formosa]XP_016521806.1 PREDICTED: high affinity immunoglobulin gamma Fc receptor I-like [Poecilia formosa]